MISGSINTIGSCAASATRTCAPTVSPSSRRSTGDQLRASGDRLPHRRRFPENGLGTIGAELQTPFPQMSYDQAIRLYGIDKPDLRLPAMADVHQAFAPENLETLQSRSRAARGRHRHPQNRELSRKERDEVKTMSAIARKPRSSKTSSGWRNLSLTPSPKFASWRSQIPRTCWSSWRVPSAPGP